MEWISVKDRLPDRLCYCLIYYCVYWNSDKMWKIRFCFVNGNNEFVLQDHKVKPTHWMPLPEPPEVEE